MPRQRGRGVETRRPVVFRIPLGYARDRQGRRVEPRRVGARAVGPPGGGGLARERYTLFGKTITIFQKGQDANIRENVQLKKIVSIPNIAKTIIFPQGPDFNFGNCSQGNPSFHGFTVISSRIPGKSFPRVRKVLN